MEEATETAFSAALPFEQMLLTLIGSGAVFYFFLYHGVHRGVKAYSDRFEVTKKMSQNRLKQQVRNAAIAPFLFAVAVGCFLALFNPAQQPLLIARFAGGVIGCYVFEVWELFVNGQYSLAAHHVVATIVYFGSWNWGRVPAVDDKLALFLFTTFIADVAHHISGFLIHCVGRDKPFVKRWLVFSAITYAIRMVVGCYCGIYAFLFLKGMFGWSLVGIAFFCLMIDRFVWFPKILLAYGLTKPAPKKEKPEFVLRPASAAIKVGKQE